MAQLGEVVFALERFELSAEERLEVVGRWEGLEGRRMGRPVLTVVETNGRKRRLTALPGGQLSSTHAWRAAFTWEGDVTMIERAELELGRRLVVELPAPRRRRRRPSQSSSQSTQAVARIEPSRNGTAHAEVEAPDTAADEALAAAREEIRELHERLQTARDGIVERDRRLMTVQAEADQAAEDATSRVDAAGAEAAELRTKLAEAREAAELARQEGTAALAAEAQETERLRQELSDAREDAARALGAEQTETARLREALAAREAAATQDDTEEQDGPGQRLLEKANRDVERERATNRTLRRELEAAQAEMAELRRATAVTPPTAEHPGVLRPSAAHRVDVARAAGAHRVPDHHPSPARLWAMRAGAALVVAALLLALVLILAPLL